MSAAPAEPARPTIWAYLSLLCGLGFFCPLTALLAIIFGGWAIVVTRRDPKLTGAPLATAGIALGVVAAAGWLVAARWWHVNARLPMIEGPAAAVRAGQTGNVAAFKEAFFIEGAAPPDEEAAAFLAALSRRYGALLAVMQEPETAAGADPDAADPAAMPDWRRVRIRYLFRFETANVPAEVEYVVAADGHGLVLKYGWLAVRDQSRGDLVYPAAAAAGAARQPETPVGQ